MMVPVTSLCQRAHLRFVRVEGDPKIPATTKHTLLKMNWKKAAFMYQLSEPLCLPHVRSFWVLDCNDTMSRSNRQNLAHMLVNLVRQLHTCPVSELQVGQTMRVLITSELHSCTHVSFSGLFRLVSFTCSAGGSKRRSSMYI